jgi:thioredoxin-like negative regulator of GroEL
MKIEEFNSIINKNNYLVAYFSHDECNLCKILRPRVESLILGFPEIEFRYINTIQSPEVAGQFMVFAVPTILIFMDGREAKRFSRHLSVQELQSFLNHIFDN